MSSMITLDRLRVECNIGQLEIQQLSICARPGKHTVVVVDAMTDFDSAGNICADISGQPLSVSVDDEVLFYGVIHSASERLHAGLLTLRITAYSLTWLFDLEQKSRSFQRTISHHAEIIGTVLKEYDTHAITNFQDRAIEKPYIQYRETDWAFLLRISSRIGAQVIPADRLDYPGIYIGFPDLGNIDQIESTAYRFGIDEGFIRRRSGYKGNYTYYEIDDYKPRRVGDLVLFRGQTLHVSSIDARLVEGVLRFSYRLAGVEYNEAQPIYNLSLRGLSLTGTVIDRQAEKLKLHLEIDEEQHVEEAYFYTWLPETGNIMYNMPPLGTRVSLHMQNADEHSAICTRNIRDNGSSNALTQNTTERYSATEHNKSFSMKPETMDLAATGTRDFTLLDDNFGCLINSEKEVLIQAKGNINISGTNVNLRAPNEVTAVRRDHILPTVLNLCHNVDTAGGKGEFYATGKYYNPRNVRRGSLTSTVSAVGEAGEKNQREKREKLRFEMERLLRQSNQEPEYDVSDIFQTILSAIPQQIETDELARLAVGSIVTVGSWEGAIPSVSTRRVPLNNKAPVIENSQAEESRGE